jgi:outer membrane beta-barrel protein
MKIKNIKKILMVMSLLYTNFVIGANSDLPVPEDELATETVYPIFDQATSVRNRNIQTTGKIDVGLFGGLALTEPIANTTKYGIAANYHFNEYHSLGFMFISNSTGLSKDAEGLRSDFGLDFSRAPQPVNTMLLDYNYKPYYGKMSFTKTGVINTTIYGSAGLGLIKYNHKSYPLLALGLGERFYFGKHLSLKTDLRMYVNQAPIPFKTGVLCDGSSVTCGNNGANGDPIPSYSDFDERITYTTNLEIGLNYLF